ncbi:hemerythrin domain-containing protein [Actinacidiphila paucisporea]|uniref:Hemerythrin HHE cation binding domain-containing protein n=1 Tax=Actinacidiphila paucisporea TaxID=310782 RepID=A0A1M7QYC8_9ACTN|nr:hemerythrin domain-containing protein [Actinacidiphila paucisporea]SHN37125.1 Hemerythrin HHE cation binding domain-containing protein [Actinacidiphila paucisporea]
MTGGEYKLDMTMMLTIHDAFRRELDRIAKVAEDVSDDPRTVMRTALGWKLFKTYLGIHHTTEDDTVWGLMEQRLAGGQDVALLHAMEAEHAAIDPLLASMDLALADVDGGPGRLGDLVAELNTSLRGHLQHEEAEGLSLVDSTLTQEEWSHFAAVHLKKVGEDVGTYMPWLLDDAAADWVETVLGRLPGWGRTKYEGEWKAAYDRLSLWTPAAGTTG